MRALDPRIHQKITSSEEKWIAGSSPATTGSNCVDLGA
jgi:hypothetical protein